MQLQGFYMDWRRLLERNLEEEDISPEANT